MIKRANHLLPDSKEISPEERKNLVDFMWRGVYEAMVGLEHTSIYVRGLGSFQMSMKAAIDLHAFYSIRAVNVKRVRGENYRYYLADVARIEKLETCIANLQKLYKEKHKIRDARYQKFIEEQESVVGRDEEQGV